MRRLSGLDAAFLALETPTSTGHVGGLSILDPSTSPEPLDLARLTALMGSRLHRVPVLRQRLQTVPLGIDQPVWVDHAPQPPSAFELQNSQRSVSNARNHAPWRSGWTSLRAWMRRRNSAIRSSADR